MIGQGVVNFGRILGPAAAALLMSLWVALLARLDLHAYEFGRLPLYCLGLILTFNMGRDISFISLYPFVFGMLLVWWIERRRARAAAHSPRTMRGPAQKVKDPPPGGAQPQPAGFPTNRFRTGQRRPIGSHAWKKRVRGAAVRRAWR